MNWTEIIRQLMKAGTRQSEIAQRVGVSQSTISQVLRSDGKRDLRYEHAARLLGLHQQVCGAPAEERPDA